MSEKEFYSKLEMFFLSYLFQHSDDMSSDAFRHCINCLKYIESNFEYLYGGLDELLSPAESV